MPESKSHERPARKTRYCRRDIEVRQATSRLAIRYPSGALEESPFIVFEKLGGLGRGSVSPADPYVDIPSIIMYINHFSDHYYGHYI